MLRWNNFDTATCLEAKLLQIFCFCFILVYTEFYKCFISKTVWVQICKALSDQKNTKVSQFQSKLAVKYLNFNTNNYMAVVAEHSKATDSKFQAIQVWIPLGTWMKHSNCQMEILKIRVDMSPLHRHVPQIS